MPKTRTTTAADLVAFQKRMGWTSNRMSVELGITPQTLGALKSGERVIRRHIALALAALAANLKVYKAVIALRPSGPTVAGAATKARQKPKAPPRRRSPRSKTKRPAPATPHPSKRSA